MTIPEAFKQYFHTLFIDTRPRAERETLFMESLHSQYYKGNKLTPRQLRLLAIITNKHEDRKYDYLH